MNIESFSDRLISTPFFLLEGTATCAARGISYTTPLFAGILVTSAANSLAAGAISKLFKEHAPSIQMCATIAAVAATTMFTYVASQALCSASSLVLTGEAACTIFLINAVTAVAAHVLGKEVGTKPLSDAQIDKVLTKVYGEQTTICIPVSEAREFPIPYDPEEVRPLVIEGMDLLYKIRTGEHVRMNNPEHTLKCITHALITETLFRHPHYEEECDIATFLEKERVIIEPKDVFVIEDPEHKICRFFMLNGLVKKGLVTIDQSNPSSPPLVRINVAKVFKGEPLWGAKSLHLYTPKRK